MKVKENLRNAIFKAIDNQISADDPVVFAITLKRLIDEGYSKFEAKQLIGKAFAVELFYTDVILKESDKDPTGIFWG